MSHLYLPLLVLHVIVAVLGLGAIAGVALVASAARRAGRDARDASPWLAPLLRYSAVSLAGMLVTGALLDLVVGGAFHDAVWFRASALLLIATGVLHARTRRALRIGSAGAAAASSTVAGSTTLRTAGVGPAVVDTAAAGTTVGATAGADRTLQRVERMAYAMCALIAVIAALMEAKPF